MSWVEDKMEEIRREHFPRRGSIESLRREVQDFPETDQMSAILKEIHVHRGSDGQGGYVAGFDPINRESPFDINAIGTRIKEIEESWHDKLRRQKLAEMERAHQEQMAKYYDHLLSLIKENPDKPVLFEGIIPNLRRDGAGVAYREVGDFWKHYEERKKQYPLKPEECVAPPIETKPTNVVKPVYNIGETPQMWVDWMNGDIPVRMGTPPTE